MKYLKKARIITLGLCAIILMTTATACTSFDIYEDSSSLISEPELSYIPQNTADTEDCCDDKEIVVSTLDDDTIAAPHSATESSSAMSVPAPETTKPATTTTEPATTTTKPATTTTKPATTTTEPAAVTSTPAPSTTLSERRVYIAASGNGSKYHRTSSCSKMKDAISLTVSEAEALGYSPCKKCYG